MPNLRRPSVWTLDFGCLLLLKAKFFPVNDFNWCPLHDFFDRLYTVRTRWPVKKHEDGVRKNDLPGKLRLYPSQFRLKVILKSQCSYFYFTRNRRIFILPFQFWYSRHYGCVQYLHFLSNHSIFSSPEGAPRSSVIFRLNRLSEILVFLAYWGRL